MILTALALAQAATPAETARAFNEVPSYVFTCSPPEDAAAKATYQYRVFLPVKADAAERKTSEFSVRVELTDIEGVQQDMTSLRLDRGNLSVFLAPGAEDASRPMFKIDAFSGSPEAVLYDFSMIFTRSVAADANGGRQVSISPSEGRLRIWKGLDEQTFRSECTHIDAGSTQ